MKRQTQPCSQSKGRAPRHRLSARPRRRIWVCLLQSLALAAALVPPAAGTCGPTTFQPVSPYVPRGTTHNAYALTDPAGEQVAVFDLQWGAALASLKQNGVEHAWGNATGGMVQPAMHGPGGPEYNPTQAGDNTNQGSVVLGVRCLDASTLFLVTSSLDYNLGRSGQVYASAVANGAVLGGSFVTPYIITTTATFVANPNAPPAYYLKLQQAFTNISSTEMFAWGFEFAGYMPYGYTNYSHYPANCNSQGDGCTSGSTPTLIAGGYPNASLTGGTAFYVSPQTNWAPRTNVFSQLAPDDINQNQSAHLFDAFWNLSPGQTRIFTWYVLVGDWAKAFSFAQQFAQQGLSFFSISPCRLLDTRTSGQPLVGGVVRTVGVVGNCGIPATAKAASFNLTAVNPTSFMSLSAFPGDHSPTQTNVLSSGRPALAGDAVLALSSDGLGTIGVLASFSASGSVDLVVDVNGYFQ